MTAIDESAAAGHGYFRMIEETFIRLRGSPLLLSPADYQVAKSWFEADIPLDVVCKTLEKLFNRLSERGEPRAIRGLKYCQRAVEQAWREQRSLTAPGVGRTATEVPVTARLEALARALPARLPGRQGLAERMVALEGPVDRVERQLSELDREMVDQAMAILDEEARAEIAREAERVLSSFEGRIPEGQGVLLRDRLLDRALRRRLALPMLSLFAPEVVEIEEDP